jgi:hypothetical protein
VVTSSSYIWHPVKNNNLSLLYSFEIATVIIVSSIGTIIIVSSIATILSFLRLLQ